MLPTIMNAVRKAGRLLSVVPVALVLLFVAMPTYAANPGAKGAEAPDATCPAGGQCFADVPSGNSFYEFVNRLYQQDIVTGYACGGPGEPCDAENRPYYRPGNVVTRQQMSKFVDQARRLPRISIDTATDLYPLISSTSGNNGIGVFGQGPNGIGVQGNSTSGWGVNGYSDNGRGVQGTSTSGVAVYGYSSGSWSGYFVGDINVTGNCTGCAGPTRIDHPLDPENKYLYHSTVQSPDMKNVYDGNIITDATGEAVVVLPDYFEAFNRDFRYQLTIVDARFAQARVSSKINDNRFTIKTDKPNVEVSWQVTGIRQDPYAEAHRVGVEEDKKAEERGKYLHPTEWGQPESKGVDYDTLMEMEQRREQDQSK